MFFVKFSGVVWCRVFAKALGYTRLDFSFDSIRCDAPGYQWVFNLEECNEAALSLSLGDVNATEVLEGDYENGVCSTWLPPCQCSAMLHRPSPVLHMGA